MCLICISSWSTCNLFLINAKRSLPPTKLATSLNLFRGSINNSLTIVFVSANIKTQLWAFWRLNMKWIFSLASWRDGILGLKWFFLLQELLLQQKHWKDWNWSIEIFIVQLRILHSYTDVAIIGKGLQNLGQHLQCTCTAFKQGRIFIVIRARYDTGPRYTLFHPKSFDSTGNLIYVNLNLKWWAYLERQCTTAP